MGGVLALLESSDVRGERRVHLSGVEQLQRGLADGSESEVVHHPLGLVEIPGHGVFDEKVVVPYELVR